jgi:hypothetical protein
MHASVLTNGAVEAIHWPSSQSHRDLVMVVLLACRVHAGQTYL